MNNNTFLLTALMFIHHHRPLVLVPRSKRGYYDTMRFLQALYINTLLCIQLYMFRICSHKLFVGNSMRFLYVFIDVWGCAEILPQLNIHQLENVQKLCNTFYSKFASLHQVCALAEPGGAWQLTFAPG